MNLYRRPADATFLINIALAFAAGYLVHRFCGMALPRLRARPGPSGFSLPSCAIALALAAIGRPCSPYGPVMLPAAVPEIGLGCVFAPSRLACCARAHPRAGVRCRGRLVAITGGELIGRTRPPP